MGLRQALRVNRATTMVDPAAMRPQVHSPWSDTSQLSSIVWADLLDADLLPITRAEAMAVPAMARARHLLCGSVATMPLRAARGAVDLDDASQPTWMYRTDGALPPYHRMLWTMDDLLFYGWSLWAVDRDVAGHVIAADRVPFDGWSFDDAGRVLVGDKPAPAAQVLLIPGPHEGVLSFAARTIRQASRMEQAAARHASNPVPSVELRQTQDVPLTDKERQDLVTAWVAARASDTGAVGFTSYGVEAHPLGQVPEQLLVEGRNAAAVDVARHVSIPAAMLDATSAGASLTYETTQGRSGQFLDYGVRLYADAVAARLSMDDVVPRGTRTYLDTAALTALVPTDDTATLD